MQNWQKLVIFVKSSDIDCDYYMIDFFYRDIRNNLMITNLLIILMFMTALPAQTQSTGACDGFNSRLSIGIQGRVASGDANNVRSSPSADAELVGQLAVDEKFMVLDGAVCADGFTWWQVESLDESLTGWTVEGSGDDYWLIPGWLGYTVDEFSVDYRPIANSATLETILPDTENYSFAFPEGAPDYLLMTFENTIVDEYISPQFTVIPVDFFATYNPSLHQTLVDYHTSLYSENPSPNDIVLLPKINAASVHFSHAELITLEDMRGYRYLAQFSQYPAPVRGYEMVYMFAGMTEDGSHFISARLPLSSIVQDIYFIDLSESERISNDAGVLPEYAEMLSTHAAELQSDEFYPDLDTLDGVIASITLGENADLPEAIDSRSTEQLTIHTTEPITNVFDFEGGFFSVQYDLFADSDSPYMSVNVMNEADLHKERMFYEAWRSVVDLFANESSIENVPSNPVVLGSYDAVVGNFEQIDFDDLKGVRFVALEGDMLKYIFWGVTPNNTFVTVQSILESTDVTDAMIAERDAVIADFSFEIRQ